MPQFKPFDNEEESVAIDNLTVENRHDRIALYGSVDITRDKQGLQRTRKLQALMNATVSALEAESLPNHVSIAPTESVKNPFG